MSDFKDFKLTNNDFVGHSIGSLPKNTYVGSAAMLKARFDASMLEVLVPAFNAMLDNMSAEDAAEYIFTKSGESVQIILDDILKRLTQDEQTSSTAYALAESAERKAAGAVEAVNSVRYQTDQTTGQTAGIGEILANIYAYAYVEQALLETISGKADAAEKNAAEAQIKATEALIRTEQPLYDPTTGGEGTLQSIINTLYEQVKPYPIEVSAFNALMLEVEAFNARNMEVTEFNRNAGKILAAS